MVTLNPRTRAFGASYGLGLAGAVLALVLSVLAIAGLTGLTSIGVSVPLSGRLIVLFVAGQYIPFIGLPLLYFRWRGLSATDIREYLGIRIPTLKEFGIVLGGLLAVGVLALGTAWIVTQVLGLTPAENNAGRLAQEAPRLIPILVVASLVVIGPSEETLFRGLVQNRLRESFSAPVAITLAAVLFAAIHVTALSGGSGARLVTIGILLIPSFVFGAAYEYTENLVVPALIHGLWNALLFSSILLAGGGGDGGATVWL